MVNSVTATGSPGLEIVVSVVPGAEAWKSALTANISQYGRGVTSDPVADPLDPVVEILTVCFSIAI